MSDSDYELDQIAEYVTLRIGYISYAGGHEILARLELNEKIDQAIENITDLSADEICMWLRSTWRVRQYILHWDKLLLEAQNILNARCGQSHANNLLYGLHLKDAVV